MNEKRVKQTSEPKRVKPFVRFGIGKRLILAFSCVSAMTVAISLIGWLSQKNLGQSQQVLGEEKVPAISSALKLSEQIANVTATIPLLSNAKSIEERENLSQFFSKSVEKANAHLDLLDAFKARLEL